MVDTPTAFGKRLAEVRKALSWSQERLALESGIARSYMSDVERGKRNITIVNVCRIANTLGVSPCVLMDFDGDLFPLESEKD